MPVRATSIHARRDFVGRPATVVFGRGRLLGWLRRGDPVRASIPGLAAAVGIAAMATALGSLAPVVGAPVIAIVSGILVTAVHGPSERLRPGVTFTSKRVLQASIVVLGFGLSLGQVLSTGTRSLPVLVGTLMIALGAAWLTWRALGLDADVGILIGTGTAICGASAIAAADSVIQAEEADVSYGIAAIFTFNVVAVLLYPTLGHLLGLSQHSFGLWAGTAINDVSSVVAASSVYGHAAASYGVVVKLTRTLAIIPICLALAGLRRHRRTATPAPAGRRVELRRIVPLFILAFVAAVILNTAHLIPPGWHHGLSELAVWMITAALAAIGLSTDFARLRQAGLRPLAMGAILWATVGVASLGLQVLTGTL